MTLSKETRDCATPDLLIYNFRLDGTDYASFQNFGRIHILEETPKRSTKKNL